MYIYIYHVHEHVHVHVYIYIRPGAAPWVAYIMLPIWVYTQVFLHDCTIRSKSTVVRLLYRFYDPAEGRILVGDQDIRDVTIDSLRRQLSIVPQDSVLFHNTIQYNIAYGRLAATHEEVLAASQMADLHSWIQEMPEKYETQVGERGLKLSGELHLYVHMYMYTQDLRRSKQQNANL